METVSAIVVIYNGLQRDWINKCFDSLLNSSVSVDIIAVDNGSTDQSARFVTERYPTVQLVLAGENLGFGKANNVAFRKAVDCNSDFVFLLNQDAWVTHETIELLIDKAKTDPSFGILSPLHLDGVGACLDRNFAEYVAPSYCPDLFSDAILNKLQDRIYPVDFVNAAAWLVSRDCLKTVGGFSPLFFHYGEDENYCDRARFNGFGIGVVPQAIVFHDRQGRKLISEPEQKRRRLVASMIHLLDPNLHGPGQIFQESIKQALRTLVTTRSITDSTHLLRHYWRNRKQIKLDMELYLSDSEYLHI